MNRSIANWLATNPGGAVFATGLLGLLPLFGLGFAFFLPGAVPALLTLRRGARAGAIVAVGAALLLALAMWSIGRPIPVGFIYAGWMLGPPLLLALVLKRSESLSLCLQLAVLAAVAMLCILHGAFGDPAKFWSPFVRELAQEMERRGLDFGLQHDDIIDMLARTLWGWVTLLTMLLAMCAVFLARWWQSLSSETGRFGAEFREIRLGRVLGVVAVVAIAASLLTPRPLIDDIARVLLGGLLLVGLSAVHRVRLRRGLHVGWLWLTYGLLVFAAPLTVAMLAGVGFVDNWLRSGTAARPA
jgi:hypothetical protein